MHSRAIRRPASGQIRRLGLDIRSSSWRLCSCAINTVHLFYGTKLLYGCWILSPEKGYSYEPTGSYLQASTQESRSRSSPWREAHLGGGFPLPAAASEGMFGHVIDPNANTPPTPKQGPNKVQYSDFSETCSCFILGGCTTGGRNQAV